MANATTSMVLRPHPFSQDHGVVEFGAGQSIGQMLETIAGGEVAETVRVELGGREVPRSMWHHTRPKAGHAIHVTRMPAGGSGKKWLRTILMIVVMVVAWQVGLQMAGTWGLTAAQWSAGIYMVGDLRVPALIPEKI